MKYSFDWSLIGNVAVGRPNLGTEVDVAVYRLMQFTLRDVLEKEFGADKADAIFYEAGKLAGAEFYQQFIAPVDSMDDFVRKTQEALREMKVGVLRIENVNEAEGTVMLTMDEDLDCSGLPELDFETCVYDEGFIAALFESYTGKPWSAKEVDCWCTGARTCRFLAKNDA